MAVVPWNVGLVTCATEPLCSPVGVPVQPEVVPVFSKKTVAEPTRGIAAKRPAQATHRHSTTAFMHAPFSTKWIALNVRPFFLPVNGSMGTSAWEPVHAPDVVRTANFPG